MKNWKTTLFGLGAGALNMFANGVNWKQILVSVGLAGLGLFAKDSNVTGGSTPQTVEATNRTSSPAIK